MISADTCAQTGRAPLLSASPEGPLPETLGDLAALTHLHLASNRIEGTVPPELADCVAMVELDLSDNLFVGSTPQTFSQLTKAKEIFLHHNLMDDAASFKFRLRKQLPKAWIQF